MYFDSSSVAYTLTVIVRPSAVSVTEPAASGGSTVFSLAQLCALRLVMFEIHEETFELSPPSQLLSSEFLKTETTPSLGVVAVAAVTFATSSE